MQREHEDDAAADRSCNSCLSGLSNCSGVPAQNSDCMTRMRHSWHEFRASKKLENVSYGEQANSFLEPVQAGLQAQLVHDDRRDEAVDVLLGFPIISEQCRPRLAHRSVGRSDRSPYAGMGKPRSLLSSQLTVAESSSSSWKEVFSSSRRLHSTIHITT